MVPLGWDTMLIMITMMTATTLMMVMLMTIREAVKNVLADFVR